MPRGNISGSMKGWPPLYTSSNSKFADQVATVGPPILSVESCCHPVCILSTLFSLLAVFELHGSSTRQSCLKFSLYTTMIDTGFRTAANHNSTSVPSLVGNRLVSRLVRVVRIRSSRNLEDSVALVGADHEFTQTHYQSQGGRSRGCV